MDIGSADSHPKASSEKCLSTMSSIWEATTTYECPGEFVGIIECMSCFRRVRVNLGALPPAPIAESFRRRLRCKACGNRGAYTRLVWTVPPAHPTIALPIT